MVLGMHCKKGLPLLDFVLLLLKKEFLSEIFDRCHVAFAVLREQDVFVVGVIWWLLIVNGVGNSAQTDINLVFGSEEVCLSL